MLPLLEPDVLVPLNDPKVERSSSTDPVLEARAHVGLLLALDLHHHDILRRQAPVDLATDGTELHLVPMTLPIDRFQNAVAGLWPLTAPALGYEDLIARWASLAEHRSYPRPVLIPELSYPSM